MITETDIGGLDHRVKFYTDHNFQLTIKFVKHFPNNKIWLYVPFNSFGRERPTQGITYPEPITFETSSTLGAKPS